MAAEGSIFGVLLESKGNVEYEGADAALCGFGVCYCDVSGRHIDTIGLL